MKIRRDVASIPKRSAKETWQAIIDLITGPGSIDSNTLVDASSVMEAIISDEHPGKTPIVLKGAGVRLVIYLAYGENAMEADETVDKLASNPTAGDWSMTAPAEAGDVTWMNNTLAKRAARITVHDVDKPVEDTTSEKAAAELTFNWGALEQP